jgi:hypothetical protein
VSTDDYCTLGEKDIALLEKKIEDLSDVVYTLEQRIDEEHVYRKSLQQELIALNHFIAKTRK